MGGIDAVSMADVDLLLPQTLRAGEVRETSKLKGSLASPVGCSGTAS